MELQLQKRRQAGKAVAVAGIAAALIVSASGCIENRTGGAPLPPPTHSQTEEIPGGILPPEELPSEPSYTTMGDVVAPETTEATEPLMGDLVPEE